MNWPFPSCLLPLCQKVRDHSPENVLCQHVNFHTNQNHFGMKGFERGLVVKQRHKLTRKWPTVAKGIVTAPNSGSSRNILILRGNIYKKCNQHINW